jgi:hypothetical protein
MPEILTPDCPMCGEPPMMVFGGGTQAFCGNDYCPVFTWDPSKSRDHFLETAREISIEQREDGIDDH